MRKGNSKNAKGLIINSANKKIQLAETLAFFKKSNEIQKLSASPAYEL